MTLRAAWQRTAARFRALWARLEDSRGPLAFLVLALVAAWFLQLAWMQHRAMHLVPADGLAEAVFWIWVANSLAIVFLRSALDVEGDGP